MKLKLTFLIASIVLFYSCSNLSKNIAADDLVGTYSGTPAMVIQWSKLNIGVEDQNLNNKESEYVIIEKDSEDNLRIKFDDGLKLKLNNVEKAQNGTIFNIPTQEVSLNSEMGELKGEVTGLSENLFGESKCDGLFDTDKNIMSFSFSGNFKIISEGVEYTVPILVGYYNFKKQ